jgi:hypothetical protein
VSEGRDPKKWKALLERLPGVIEVNTVDDHLIAMVQTGEHGREVRSAANDLGIPEGALRIRLLRYWLEPYPGEPVINEELLKQQITEWEREDQDL